MLGTAQVFVSEQFKRTQSFLNPGNLAMVQSSAPLPMTTTFVQPLGLDSAIRDLAYSGGVDFGSISRAYGEEDTLDLNVTDNKQFVVEKSSGYNFLMPRDPDGHQPLAGAFTTLALPTEYGKHKPRQYYTRFCALKGHKAFKLLDNTPNNLARGMYRIYQARQPENGSDAKLRQNQASLLAYLDYPRITRLVSNSPQLAMELVDEAKARMTPIQEVVARSIAAVPSHLVQGHSFLIPLFKFMLLLLTFLYYPLSLLDAGFARLNQVLRPHDKKKLYQSWFQKLLYLGSNSYSQIILETIKVKNKIELSKPGKHIRLYVTYGMAYMNASFIYVFLKKLCATVYDLKDLNLPFPVRIQIHMSLDTSSSLDPFYEGLQIHIYSDDMAFMFRRGLFTFKGDIDIASCDAGNTFSIFGVLFYVIDALGFGALIQNNFRVLRQPIVIENPLNKLARVYEFLKVRPVHLFQGSGCPETTMVNDLASYTIGVATAVRIAHHLQAGLPIEDLDFPSAIFEAAAEVGHMVTVKECSCMEETTFLKHSPMMSEQGHYVNVLNLGAILRSLGSYLGDLEAKSLNITTSAFRRLSAEARVELYIGSVVAGHVHEPASLIMDALRARFPAKSALKTRYFQSTHDRSHYSIPLESFQRRYGGTDAEWHTLAEQIQALRFGEIRFAPIWDTIMAVDYGL
jgi:hypothetical protein